MTDEWVFPSQNTYVIISVRLYNHLLFLFCRWFIFCRLQWERWGRQLTPHVAAPSVDSCRAECWCVSTPQNCSLRTAESTRINTRRGSNVPNWLARSIRGASYESFADLHIKAAWRIAGDWLTFSRHRRWSSYGNYLPRSNLGVRAFEVESEIDEGEERPLGWTCKQNHRVLWCIVQV